MNYLCPLNHPVLIQIELINLYSLKMSSCLKISQVFVIALLTVFLICETKAARSCESINKQPGRCIPIVECPTLLHMIHSKNRQELRKLQLLTCGFQQSTPKVCCPVEEKQEERTTTDPPKTTTVNITNNNNDIDISYERSQANFSLFPPLHLCSLTAPIDRVIGGQDVARGAYPWIARIGYKTPSKRIVFGCGGAVITERYILTAAHCMKDFGDTLEVHQVRLAEHDVTTNPDCSNDDDCTDAKDVMIEKIIVHPEYNLTSKLNDIALIRLAEPIDFKANMYIQPVCLPFMKKYGLKSFQYNDQYAVAAGWGKTHWNRAKGSEVLQDVKLPIVENDECNKLYSEISQLKIGSLQLCAGGQLGLDTCDGDSGGPLMWLHKESQKVKFFQIGIVSYGPTHCGSGALPGVYTRVSTYLQWIVDNVKP